MKRTQSDQSTEQPWTQSLKIVLRSDEYCIPHARSKLTLDWNVNKVNPRKTPNVISLTGWVSPNSNEGNCAQAMYLQCLEYNDVVVEGNHYTKSKSLH